MEARMTQLATKKTDDFDLEKALKRMQYHADKTRLSFDKALKVKSPKTLAGRLAGPAKA